MTFHKQLVTLMSQVGITDFSIRDLIKPDSQRVKKIMSAVINFAKFREEQLPVFDKYTERSEQYETQHRQLVDTVESNKTRLLSLRIQREEEAPLIAQRKEENEILRTDLKNLKRQQSALTNDIDTLKREKNVLTEKLTNNEYVLQNTKQDIVKTRARIVTSPEKLKLAIREMSSSLMSEKSSVSTLGAKHRDLQVRIDAMSVIEGDIMGCIKLMEECESELQRVEEATRKVGRHREQFEGKQLEMKEVDVKEQQLLRQLANAEDKLGRVRRTAVSKREAAQKKMQTIREEYNIMSQERATRMQEMDKKKAMIEQTEKKVCHPQLTMSNNLDCRSKNKYRTGDFRSASRVFKVEGSYREVHGRDSVRRWIKAKRIGLLEDRVLYLLLRDVH